MEKDKKYLIETTFLKQLSITEEDAHFGVYRRFAVFTDQDYQDGEITTERVATLTEWYNTDQNGHKGRLRIGGLGVGLTTFQINEMVETYYGR